MKTRLALSAGLLAVVLCAAAGAQDYKPFPGKVTDSRTLAMQERVEELYVAGNFDRAFFIYENELAPIGDKYAQYMVGFMHLNAQAVPQNKARALAWYRLAAERGEPVLEQARSELIEAMTAREIAESNLIFLDLWEEYSDTRIMMRLIREDMAILKARTGTRITGSTSTSPTVVLRPSGIPRGPNFYRDVRTRLEARLTYLNTKVEVHDIALETSEEEFRILEEEVREELAALEVP